MRRSILSAVALATLAGAAILAAPRAVTPAPAPVYLDTYAGAVRADVARTLPRVFYGCQPQPREIRGRLLANGNRAMRRAELTRKVDLCDAGRMGEDDELRRGQRGRAIGRRD